MSKTSRRRNPKFTQSLLRWHRRIGLTSALFVILLVLTGIPLHHATQLGLTDAQVEQNWLLESYGIEPPAEFLSFSVNGQVITQVEDALYFNQQFILDKQHALIGVVATESIWVAVTRHDLLLMSSEAELIDQIPLSTRIDGVASDNSRVYISDGAHFYQLNDSLDGIQKVEVEHQSLQWVKPSTPDDQLQLAIANDFRSRSLNWERVLLDLHSGRLFGSLGPWIMDIAALLFLLMAVTGVWIWSRRR